MGAHDRGAGRAGRPGKLSGDPAIQQAAVAVLSGTNTGLGFLSLDPDDAEIEYEVALATLRLRKELVQYDAETYALAIVHVFAQAMKGGR